MDQDDDDFITPVHVISPLQNTTCRWTGNDSAGISAWAADIPYGPPAIPSSSSSPSHSVHRPPQLLSRHPRIIPPSLCKNTSTPRAIPPLSTPKPLRLTVQPSDNGRTSLKSALTESSLATPASSHPIQQPLGLGDIYSHVRSWVTPSSLVHFKRAPSPAKVKSLKFTPSTRITRPHSVKVVSSPDTPHGFLDDHWKASAMLLEQPRIKRAPGHQQLRLPHDVPRLADQDSSFRARGRKASRAVA